MLKLQSVVKCYLTDKAIDIISKIRQDKDDLPYSGPPIAGKSYPKPLIEQFTGKI